MVVSGDPFDDLGAGNVQDADRVEAPAELQGFARGGLVVGIEAVALQRLFEMFGEKINKQRWRDPARTGR